MIMKFKKSLGIGTPKFLRAVFSGTVELLLRVLGEIRYDRVATVQSGLRIISGFELFGSLCI